MATNRRQGMRKGKSARTSRRKIDPSEINELKTAFGIDNAKQLDAMALVKFFVPQPAFHRLFVAKNQILLGSRGSGKTTWVRMLAHDHVLLAAKERDSRTDYARSALRDNLVGIYIPASAAFAGDLKNKGWQTEAEAEEYFVWRMNLHSCSALCHIIDSCVERYASPSSCQQATEDICAMLGHAWGAVPGQCNSVRELQLLLTSLELRHQAEMRKRRTGSGASGSYQDYFDNDLFLPLKNAINIIKTVIPVPKNAVWMICIDEVEYLLEIHHRILNTQIRASNADFVFKIATMPFAHHTLATNVGDPVREGNDFEYIYVDQDSIDSRGGQYEGEFLKFARRMFQLRMSARSSKLEGITLKSLLGPSPLIDSKKVETAEERDDFMRLVKQHANPHTLARAERLKETDLRKFGSEIVRKMHGALLLKDALASAYGNAKLRIYSGESMVVRCCDGNPRRLMRVINQLVQRVQIAPDGTAVLPLDPAIQNEILETLARDTISRVHSEPPNGALVAQYLHAIGKYVEHQFAKSDRQLGTDQVTSVQVLEQDGVDAVKFIKQAVQLSLMIPSKSVTMGGTFANCEGTYHLAFLFAPLFRFLPRRNEAVRLSKILGFGRNGDNGAQQLQQTLL